MICAVIGKGAITRCNAKFATRKLICPSAVHIVAGNSAVYTVCQEPCLLRNSICPLSTTRSSYAAPSLQFLPVQLQFWATTIPTQKTHYVKPQGDSTPVCCSGIYHCYWLFHWIIRKLFRRLRIHMDTHIDGCFRGSIDVVCFGA